MIKRPPSIKDPELNRIFSDIYDELTRLSNELEKYKIVATADKGVAIQVKDKKGFYQTSNLTGE